MKLIAKLLLAWGMLDSMLLAAKPELWTALWAPAVNKIGSERKLSGLVAGFQFALCAWLLKKI
ncbi:MAG TPA: hypothetical protein V6C81_14435 [Planktothrix sp.]|jgi:hypothetical protein